MNQKRRSWLRSIVSIPAGWWAVLLTLPVLAPLARPGFFESHDGLLHVYRVAALDRALRAGVPYPRWFPEFAFDYGHPVLNFYGPLSYYWALPWTLLGFDPTLATKLVLAAGLLASAGAMYLFARCHLRRVPALVAAVVYAYLPYHLVDLYVRGALAEFLAFVWFPLILWAFHRLVEVRAGDRGPLAVAAWLVLAALTLLGLVATHSLSAFIFAPVLAGYLLVTWWPTCDRKVVALAVLALGLGVALSAFYWLPVLLESRYVGLGHGTSAGYADHMLSLSRLVATQFAYNYTLLPEKPVTFALGLVQAGILLAGVLLVAVRKRGRPVLGLFVVVALVATAMLSRESLPLWRLFESGLAFLQYPWRFHALAVLAAAMIAGYLVEAVAARSVGAAAATAALLGILVALSGVWALPVKPVEVDASTTTMWAADRQFGQVGATWTGEYLPVWVTEQRWALSLPVTEAADPVDLAAVPPPGVRLVSAGHTRCTLDVEAPQGGTIVLHQFYYPGWSAVWQDAELAARPAGKLGLAAFDLPAGSGRLVVRLASTAAQLWGTLVSLVAALGMAVMLVAALQSRVSIGRKGWYATLAVGCLLLVALLGGSLIMPNGHLTELEQVGANLENRVELLAFHREPGQEAIYHPGDEVEVTLYWRALAPLAQDYKASVQLTDVAITRQPVQHDSDPGRGYSPTTRWLPGELVTDTHTLNLPADLAPGRYRLWAAMYEFSTLRNLPVTSSQTETDGLRVALGEIEVVAP